MLVAQSRPTTPAQPATNRLTSAARKVFTRSPKCQKKGQGEGSQLQHSGDQDAPHAALHARPVFMLEIHSASCDPSKGACYTCNPHALFADQNGAPPYLSTTLG